MNNEAALTVLTIAAVPGLFSDLDDGTRRAEIEAATLGLVMGAAASSLARTPWPLIATGAMVAYAVWRRQRRREELSRSGGESVTAAATIHVRGRYG